MTSCPMDLYIPEGADRPAPDKTMMFLEDSRTFLNSVTSEEGAIDFQLHHSSVFYRTEREKGRLTEEYMVGSSSEG